MRRLLPIFALFVTCATAVGGCATSSASESEPEPGAIGAPTDENDDERPVWAEGPVDDTTERPEETSKAEESSKASPPPQKPSPRRRQTDAPVPEGLDGVFPDETVSLDFRKATIGRILRVFKVKAHLDIVLSDEVVGRIAIRTDEVPLEEAFRAVLSAGDLTYERRESVLIVKPAAEE